MTPARFIPSTVVDPAIDEADDDSDGDRFFWDPTGKHGDRPDDYEGDD